MEPDDQSAAPPDEPRPATVPASVPGGRWRRALTHRRALAVVTAAAVAVALLIAGVGAANVLADRSDPDPPAGQWQTVAPAPSATATPAATAPPTITLSATGDIILGNAGSQPPRLPAGDGAGFFDDVADALAADLVMGNLEQPLTGDTGYRKCGEDSTACHAFRAPPGYAAHLREAGFDLLNLANNHGNDYGPEGLANTRAALRDHGIAYTGAQGEVTVVDVEGISVAVVGFSPYVWTNDLNDHDQAAGVVSRAAGQADLVVVQVHMGAEGSDQTGVSPGTEVFFGENRGDPMAFSRAVIDAGADLVVGHGPHVLRGLEVYQGRLIAYSLGNFAGGGGTLSADGPLGLGAVLRVSLHADGTFAGGELVSTHMYDAGRPALDSQQRSLDLVRGVTERDFPETGPALGRNGEITPP